MTPDRARAARDANSRKTPPMAMPIRLEFEGALYHVTSRGDWREDIYETDNAAKGVSVGLRELDKLTLTPFASMPVPDLFTAPICYEH